MEQKSQNESPKLPSLAKIYEHDSWQSFKSVFFKFIMRLANAKSAKRWEYAIEGNPQPDKFRSPAPPENFYKEFQITSSQLNGNEVYRLEPKGKESSIVILYIHGGAYVNNSTTFHWNMIQDILKDNHCTIIYPDYPLAPKATHVEGFQFMDTLYQQILSEVDPKNLVFMGDSAGAGFALAFSQKLKKEGAQQPSQLILLSPWLDISCTNPEMLQIDKDDPMLPIEGLKKCGELWAKGIDVKNPLVSPLYGDVESLPPISVFAGTHDLLEPDMRKFRDRCDDQGVSINYFNYPKMLHVWMIMGLSESKKTLEQIKELIAVKSS